MSVLVTLPTVAVVPKTALPGRHEVVCADLSPTRLSVAHQFVNGWKRLASGPTFPTIFDLVDDVMAELGVKEYQLDLSEVRP